MREAWMKVIENFNSFIGSGWLVWVCFCAALIVCLIRGKERRKLFTFCAVAMAFLFNPVVYEVIGEHFMSGVYWRLFWILPVVATIALVLTDAVGLISKRLLRLVAVGVLCIVIAKTGFFFFNGETYCKPENDYQIPQVAIDVCDEILTLTNGGDCMVIVPDELVCYIRQYTSHISLFYGRNIWGFMNNPTAEQLELYQLLHEENRDYQAIHDQAKAYGCHYIVFNPEAVPLPDDMEAYGFVLAASADRYLIYSLE